MATTLRSTLIVLLQAACSCTATTSPENIPQATKAYAAATPKDLAIALWTLRYVQKALPQSGCSEKCTGSEEMQKALKGLDAHDQTAIKEHLHALVYASTSLLEAAQKDLNEAKYASRFLQKLQETIQSIECDTLEEDPFAAAVDTFTSLEKWQPMGFFRLSFLEIFSEIYFVFSRENSNHSNIEMLVKNACKDYQNTSEHRVRSAMLCIQKEYNMSLNDIAKSIKPEVQNLSDKKQKFPDYAAVSTSLQMFQNPHPTTRRYSSGGDPAVYAALRTYIMNKCLEKAGLAPAN